MSSNALLIRALRGPLLLISAGVLFVLDHNTSFDFSKTWPALVILFGLLKLLERVALTESSAPPPPASPFGSQGGMQ